MAKIAKFNFFLAAPNLIIFLLRQIKFMAKKKKKILVKKSKFASTLLIFLI